MIDTGVIHGRFQVLHKDHLKYILAAKKRCKHLVVGITNPDPLLTKEDPADSRRSLPVNNPLTYFERYTTVRSALMEADVSPQDFSVVPFPVNFPEIYKYYVPLNSTFYLTIYDEWGKRKLEQFKVLDLKTEILWVKSLEEKGLSGSDIRNKMAAGEAWKHLVPPSTCYLMKKWAIPERLRGIHQCDGR